MRAFNFKDTYKRFIHKRCFAPSRMADTSREMQTPQRLFELRLHAPASRNSTKAPKNGPNPRISSNFSDFFNVKSLANPHKIRFIQNVDLIGALYKRR